MVEGKIKTNYVLQQKREHYIFFKGGDSYGTEWSNGLEIGSLYRLWVMIAIAGRMGEISFVPGLLQTTRTTSGERGKELISSLTAT